MSLKICHNNEIHRISKAPVNLSELHNQISSLFHNPLPTHYRLEYIDNDGDRIIISNDYSYREFVHSELPTAGRPVKVYVNLFDKDKKKNQIKNLPEAHAKKYSDTAPIHIQNKREFASELQQLDPRKTEERMNKDAPSDESLPSSSEDHEEKVHEINETVEDLKRQGRVDLQPKIYADPESDKELKKKEKPGKKVQKEKVTQSRVPRPRSPLEFVVNQVLQSMIPEIRRITGEHIDRARPATTRAEKPSGETSTRVTHPRIICDGCSMRPIVGVRYKCTVCLNFDYCENCEERMGHPHPFFTILTIVKVGANCEERMGHSHPFIKIRTPQQDYFSHGVFHEIPHRRLQPTRVASGSDKYQHQQQQHHELNRELYEPMHGYGPKWAPRISAPKEEDHRSFISQQMQPPKTTTHATATTKPQKTKQQEPKSKFAPKEHPQDKENVPTKQEARRDRSEEVEIEDETHLFNQFTKQEIKREVNELKERQNQEWVSGKWNKRTDDLNELEKGKKSKVSMKEQLGDVKTKASKLKKEFPNTKFDTLIKFVEEAPEDLSTDELIQSFVAWR